MNIQGRKKGGGRAPTEAANTLRSTQLAEVQLLISEGEAQGLVNGLKSVYLDGVPLQNQNGTFNFEGVEFAYLPGTQGQPALPGLATVQNEVAVAVQVDQATPVVRTITDAEVDHVRVTLLVPQLTLQDTASGDLLGSEFEYTIEIQAGGAGYVERHRETIRGKTTSAYSKAVRIELSGAAPWDVRVKRITADPAAANIVNRFSWASYTEIVSVKLRYPNSAVAFLRVAAESFNRLPTIAFDWLGQRFKVPSNYNPLTRAYTGVWNGTFTTAWANSAPWVLYDLITQPRYGLGQFVPAALANKWNLYAIGQYCDALVPDGRGGTEPRFTINVSITNRVEAFNLLQDLAAIFRGLVFWANNTVDFVQDAPADATLLYTPANVVDGLFTYSDTSEKTKHSMFVCWWSDLSQFGKRVPEVYIDEALVARYGLRELELQPLGITSRGQAARVCRWARHSEQLEGDIVNFEVGSDGVAVGVGRVFKIADPSEAGERLGGRIHAAVAAAVTLDAEVTLAGGEAYTLTVLQPDPADPTKLLTEARAVTNAAGAATVLNVAPAFSAAPAAGTVWLLESTGIVATSWRCIDVDEVKGANRYRITAVAHNPSKYAAIESGLKLDARPISRLRLSPPKPASIACSETVYQTGQIFRSRVNVSWPEPAKGLMYALSWRLNGGAWTNLPVQSNNSADIDGLAPGALDLVLRSANGLGNTSLPVTASFAVVGAGQLSGVFRAVARGYDDTQGPVAGGLYDAKNVLISNVSRSYIVNVIRRSDGVVLSGITYDVYADAANATAMAAALNALTSDKIVVVRTSDEPFNNRLANGLEAAMYRCGASRAVFGSPQFKARSAYVLVAIAGCGEGQGYEAYQGAVDSATDAWCDASFMIAAGKLIVSGSSSTPRTLADYSYTGELDATKGAVAGTNLLDSNGRVTSDPRLLGNLLDAGTWVLGSTGGQPGFTANADAAENTIVIADAPDATHRAVWRATSADVVGTSGDGGWDGAPFNIDASKQYRFSVWIRASGTLDGFYYLGPGQSTGVNDIGGGLNANPYFIDGARAGLVTGRWYLLTGFVMPSGYGGAQLNLGGLYDGVTGQRVAAGTDFRWIPGQTTSYHRAYQYYASVGAVQDFFDPRVDLCNGNEPSLAELLKVAGTAQIGDAAVTDGGTTSTAYAIFAIDGHGAAATRDTLTWLSFGSSGVELEVTHVGTGKPLLISCGLGWCGVDADVTNAPAFATLGMQLYDVGAATSLREATMQIPLLTVVAGVAENDGGGHGTYDFKTAQSAFAFTHEVPGFVGTKTFRIRRGYNLINASGTTVAPAGTSWKSSCYGGGSINVKEYKK